MNTCDTCKWWGEPETELRPSWGIILKGMARCGNEKLDSGLNSSIVSDYDAPTQGFTTGPKFGCVHYEPK